MFSKQQEIVPCVNDLKTIKETVQKQDILHWSIRVIEGLFLFQLDNTHKARSIQKYLYQLGVEEP